MNGDLPGQDQQFIGCVGSHTHARTHDRDNRRSYTKRQNRYEAEHSHNSRKKTNCLRDAKLNPKVMLSEDNFGYRDARINNYALEMGTSVRT